MPLHPYEVGKPYHPTRRSWPERAVLRLTAAGADLTLFLNRPTSREIHGVRRGAAEFAWIDAEDTGVLAYRFTPGIPWSDAPYHPHREERGHIPGIPADAGALLLPINLVDAATGIITAMRQLTWTQAFTAAVRVSVDRMWQQPTNPAAVDAAVNNLFARYPATPDLIAACATVSCRGGTE